MKVHHINCATLCPRGGRFVFPTVAPSGSLVRDVLAQTRMVCHCLLVESNDGLVLVDTGFGLRDVQNPWWRLGPGVVALLNPRFDEAETAVRQVERLGFSARDVRHIVPTHLDLDHAGGLPDFPWATVHVFEPEYEAATRPSTLKERGRYRANQFAHHPRWKRYELGAGERWFGLEAVRGLAGLTGADGDEFLLVPTLGHTRGHVAVAVRGGARREDKPPRHKERQGRGITSSDLGALGVLAVDIPVAGAGAAGVSGPEWLLHCGDAYFIQSELDPAGRRCPPFLEVFQRVDHHDGRAWRNSQDRLRALAREHASDVRLFPAHDPEVFEQLSGDS